MKPNDRRPCLFNFDAKVVQLSRAHDHTRTRHCHSGARWRLTQLRLLGCRAIRRAARERAEGLRAVRLARGDRGVELLAKGVRAWSDVVVAARRQSRSSPSVDDGSVEDEHEEVPEGDSYGQRWPCPTDTSKHRHGSTAATSQVDTDTAEMVNEREGGAH